MKHYKTTDKWRATQGKRSSIILQKSTQGQMIREWGILITFDHETPPATVAVSGAEQLLIHKFLLTYYIRTEK